MEKEWLYRSIDSADIKEAIELYIEVFSAEPWNDQLTFQQIADYIKSLQGMNTFKGFILRNEATGKLTGVALGFVRPWYQGLEYHMDAFYISNELQRKGIGSCFMTKIKQSLAEENIPDIILDTERGYPAEGFYLKNGFNALAASVLLSASTQEV
ncbi:GNAT family N-acetyltransferase [Enterococcus sp. LJL51]|uniref:GNAT family N-acetyltransferase n=1 Tax=Enterococcus sp. LJL51 TaxID=3416656 RepID=UPI003CF7C04C